MSELSEYLKSVDRCPSCGMEDFEVKIQVIDRSIYTIIYCSICGDNAWSYTSPEDAIKSWNKLPRSEGLKPCPECGEKDMVRIKFSQGRKACYASCSSCGTQTRVLPTVEQAIRLWNELPRSYEEIAE